MARLEEKTAQWPILQGHSRLTWLALGLLLIGAVGFVYDFTEDLLEFGEDGEDGIWLALWSLLWQAGCTVGLGYAALVLLREITNRARQLEQARSSNALLRGELQQVLAQRFDAWRLSPAERDIAVLVLKGLKSANIAAARNTADGTIRAQTAAVFRKAGVSSRSEFSSLFLDEFLTAGADRTA